MGDTLSQRAGPWLAKLSEGFQKDALSYMLFLRLVPAFPFWFVNIAPAVLGVPLKTFVLGTFVGIIPATFAFASAGAGLDSVIMAAKNEHAACVAAEGGERLPVQDPRQLAPHQGADRWPWCWWAWSPSFPSSSRDGREERSHAAAK